MEQIKICGPDLTHFSPQVVQQVLAYANVVVSLGSGCGVAIVVSPFVDISVVIIVVSPIFDMAAVIAVASSVHSVVAPVVVIASSGS